MVKTLCVATALSLFLSLSTQPALAVEETPQRIPGGTMVSAEKAKALYDNGTSFVDTRVASEYAEKHIKGAINVPYKEKFARVSKVDSEDSFNVGGLPLDKNKSLVFYCNGSPCWKSYKGATEAIKAGYTQVHWFRDGIPAWEDKHYPTE